jgi:SAM-dependent methyltransferase
VGIDLAAMKERVRATWAEGDYSRVAKLLEPAAAALVDACAISAGQEVLDVAAGDGNLAILAAREGAKVVASDLTPAMLEKGRARAEAEGVEVEWVEGDAEELPFPDASFDCAASVFGAMFAPRPEVVAAELFRVVRPGGTVGMANWTPDSYAAGMSRVSAKYLPMPDALPSPMEWGDEAIVRKRLEGLAGSVELRRADIVYGFGSPAEMESFMEEAAPPVAAAKRRMPPEVYEQAAADLRELAAEFNEADDGSVRIRARYLIVVARKRG